MIARDNTPRATEAQINFLKILFNDLGFDRVNRNAWLTEEAGREIHFLDELTIGEASRFIESLKEQKQDKAESMPDNDPWYDDDIPY